MAQRIIYIDDTLNKKKIASTINNELYQNSRISFTSSYNHKFNASVSLKAGVFINDLFYRFKRNKLDFTSKIYKSIINSDGSAWLIQPYWQMSLKPGIKWTINPGIHFMHFTLNNQTIMDPRLSLQYRINSKQSLNAAYGLYSKLLPLGSYFYNDSSNFPNRSLDMMRSHHFILAFDQLLTNGWHSRCEFYYQMLFNIPVVNDPGRTFWILNELDGYAKEPLVSKGKGINKGIDLLIEKFFSKGLFMIGNFSIFSSTYQPINGKTYNTRFNSATAGSLTGAKEWELKKNRTVQLGWKAVYNGGFRITPLSDQISTSREPIIDEENPYSEKISPYIRTDFRLALRKDKSKVAWQLALDIQNITNTKNVDGLFRRYDPSINQWIYDRQSGLVPVLSYQIDF